MTDLFDASHVGNPDNDGVEWVEPTQPVVDDLPF